MFKSSKHAFWEALLLTVFVFIIGIFIGIAYEGSRLDKINEYYALSEISLMDAFGLNNALGTGTVQCDALLGSNIEFADKIYAEALILEKYEDSGKLTNELRLAHKRYDLLRTILWLNYMEMPTYCKAKVSSVVYLYEFETDDLAKRATQRVWSRILFDLKQEKGNEILLIPIAVDSDITSLNYVLKRFDISSFPAIIINEENVVSTIKSVDDLKIYLE